MTAGGERDPDATRAVRGAVRDAVDLHIHSAPDLMPRCVTAISAAEAAKRAGMRAIVVKSHSTDTSARAETASDVVGFPVYGGVALNYPVGGLNHHAVSESARQGGRFVWMPTIGARHFIANAHHSPKLQAQVPKGVRGLTILAPGRDRLVPAVDRILDLVVEHDLVLASGHLSPDETGALFTEARSRGVRRLIVTHPHQPFVGMSIPDMRALAELGAYLEITPRLTIDERAHIIREVGVQHFFVSTDGGTDQAPPPVLRLYESVVGLRSEGFTDDELRHLVVAVPAHVLGLAGHDEPPRLVR